MTRREAIEAHWPIFKELYLAKHKTQILPEGAALVSAFYDYLDEYHCMAEVNEINNEPIVMPEPPEGADE
jgi:hypothetical protein